VTYINFDLSARVARAGGVDGLVGGEDPEAADATARVVPVVERQVVGLLHHELRLVQLDTAEASGEVARRAAGVGGVGQRRRQHRRRHQQKQQRARA